MENAIYTAATALFLSQYITIICSEERISNVILQKMKI